MRGTFEFLQISKVGKDKTIFGAQKKVSKDQRCHFQLFFISFWLLTPSTDQQETPTIQPAT